jgi:hypothetical protein
MIFNLNIVDLTINITSWNEIILYIKKNYCSIKLSTIPLHTKFIRQELQFSWFFKLTIKLDKILSWIKLRL